MSEKIYCGSGRIIKTKFGEMTKISFRAEDLQTMQDYMKDNNLTWINLNFKEKQNKVEGKPTHYCEVDTYVKPDPGAYTPQPEPVSQTFDAPFESTDDLPF